MEKKQYTAEYKAKIVLEILAEETNISEIAARESLLMAKVGQLTLEVDWPKEEIIKARLDFWHTKQCGLGTRGLKKKRFKEEGLVCGCKLIARYMAEMGIHAVYPKPNLSKNKQHKAFPYLLRNLPIYE